MQETCGGTTEPDDEIEAMRLSKRKTATIRKRSQDQDQCSVK